MTADADRFYQDLPAFGDFRLITEADRYRAAPDDWWVFVTDVTDSTGAIARGRYKDVNILGAASISTAIHAVDVPFPFAFGGDGAALVVPGSARDRVSAVLAAVARLAARTFDLNLRVGAMCVRDVTAGGRSVEVAKFELIHGRSTALFRGGGLAYVDAAVKADPARYAVNAPGTEAVELKGLSCRWNEIPNRRGRVLSMLVRARGDQYAVVYDQLLEHLDHLFDGDLAAANPVNEQLMTYRTIRQCMRDERRYHSQRGSLSYVLRLMEIFVAVATFGWGLHPIILSPGYYRKSMRLHSDYQKFDDMLRMTIDCSTEQADSIRKFLEARRQRGELDYGLHESGTSLMTCFVQSVHDGGHIHFIDAGDGGYAMAARMLKEQMRGDDE